MKMFIKLFNQIKGVRIAKMLDTLCARHGIDETVKAVVLENGGVVPQQCPFPYLTAYTELPVFVYAMTPAAFTKPMWYHKGCIAHELGHIAKRHTSIEQIRSTHGLEHDQVKEFEADAWAVTHGHRKALKRALIDIRNWLINNGLDNLTLQEVNERLAVLKRKG